jgi:hypothetical protein
LVIVGVVGGFVRLESGVVKKDGLLFGVCCFLAFAIGRFRDARKKD